MSGDTVLDGHIIHIIQNQDICEQNDLQNALKKSGYDIPQATLSRRLKKLGIAKVFGIYKIIDFKQPNLPLVLNIQVSEFGLIILHTHPGNANSLAYFIDQKYVTYHTKNPKNSRILGTIAGDDTVLVIIQGKKYLQYVLTIMDREFPYLGMP
jgi:transcriptional regulator of arginine metabolism